MSLKYQMKRALLPIKQNYERKLHELRYIFFELTHKCNLACVHCGSDCQKNNSIPDLPQEKVLEVLKEIKGSFNSHKVMVVLSGGEPTIYPEVFELGKKIIDLEFPWGMVTNGFSWSKDMVKKAKAARMHSVTISFDGLEESHNWLRGDIKSFRKAENAVRMLLADPFYKAMDIITCVNKRNIDELDELYDYVKKMGVKKWRFFTISPIGRAPKVPDLFLNPEQFHRLMQKILEFKKRREIQVDYSESGYLGAQFEHKVRNHDFFCRAGVNVSGIMVNGDILACPNIDRKFVQGNIYKDSFMDVWENRYKEFRNRNWMKKGQCGDCSEWRQCQGGGIHLWSPGEKDTKLCHYNCFDLQESPDKIFADDRYKKESVLK